MFWDSVLSGLGALFRLPVLVGLGYVFLMSLLNCLASYRATMERIKSDSPGQHMSLFRRAFFDELFNMAEVLGFVLICAPAVVGDGGFTSPATLGHLVWPAIKYTVIVSLVVSLLEVTPIIGHLIDEVTGMAFFMRAAWVLKLLSPALLLPEDSQTSLITYAAPSIFLCIGYILIAYILFKIVWFSLLGTMVLIFRRRGRQVSIDEKYLVGMFGGLFLNIVDAPVGVVVLLMYGQYIANSFHMA